MRAGERDKVSRVGFRPRARMVKILGEHLIRDNTVGLMELIKNGYDADATEVDVEILNIRDPGKTVVLIRDNGHGMTEEDLRGPWFEPAHGGKEAQKERQQRTELGRLPIGEKGVGRFASHKLGRYLELVSRPKGKTFELYVKIDWGEFEDSDRYLDEVRLEIRRRDPQVFTGKASGTQLRMWPAKQEWQKRDIQRLHASLLRLVSPHKGVKNFKVRLKCPEFPEFENLDTSDILERFHFRIDCIVDEKGIAEYEFRSRTADGKVQVQKEECNLWAQVNADEWQDHDPACGPFFVQVSAWLNKASLLEKCGLNRDQLRALGGASIYRDGFRILPYGDEGDDWLGLDMRRINDPSVRFGNRQIIGLVEIDQVQNRDLIDKTNREGLQENRAYLDLRELVLGAVQKLEQDSLPLRQEVGRPTVSKKELETTIRQLEDKVKQLAVAPAPSGGDSETEAAEGGLVTQQGDYVRVRRKDLEQLQEDAGEIRESVKEIYESQEEERETFLHLLGIGLAAERFTHEFDRLVDGSSECVSGLKPLVRDERSKELIDRLDLFINVLRNEVRLMGALRYVRRSQRAENISVRRVTELVLMAHDDEIKQNGVKLDLQLSGDFQVYISEASLAQVLDNVVHNGIHWLKQKSERHDRRLRVELDPVARAILISNNGPGILPNVRGMIFRRPFVTQKPDGRGLGMYIAAKILERNGGAIRIMTTEENERVLGGAGFEISFTSSRPEEEILHGAPEVSPREKT